MDYERLLLNYYKRDLELLSQGVVDDSLKESIRVIEEKVPNYKDKFDKKLFVNEKFKGLLLTVFKDSFTLDRFNTEEGTFKVVNTVGKWNRLNKEYDSYFKVHREDYHQVKENMDKVKKLWSRSSDYQIN